MSTVIKVGGSLFSLPNLGPLLHGFLMPIQEPSVYLFPGGGTFADAVRNLDAVQSLGPEASHWLALRALTMSAHFLAALLPGVPVVTSAVMTGRVILDPHALAVRDEFDAEPLPHSWSVTSDSLAVQAADRLGAKELILLKSTPLPRATDWVEAGRLGLVDTHFARALARAKSLSVRWVNLRAWQL